MPGVHLRTFIQDFVRVAKSARAERTDEGFVRAYDVVLARTGIYHYPQADGTVRRRYRPPEEVGAPEALASFAGKPITNLHPQTMVTPETARAHSGGALGDTLTLGDDGNVRVSSLTLHAADLIRAYDAGTLELSLGYWADIVEHPGVTPEGEHYDDRQTNIRGNHVALVPQGRAGRVASLPVMDGLESITEKPLMKKIQIDGVEVEVADEGKALVESAIKRREEERDAALARAEKAEGERDAFKRLAEAKTPAEDIAKAVQARRAFERDAAVLLPADYDFDGKTDHEVRVAACIEQGDSAEALKDVSEAYVAAAFDVYRRLAARKPASTVSTHRASAIGDSKPEQKPQGSLFERLNKAQLDAAVAAFDAGRV